VNFKDYVYKITNMQLIYLAEIKHPLVKINVS